ncbi:fibronectin type III domain-containing protein [Paenarthrobacter sp. NPDC058040]|uniref:fibronectin type III domain-containing protein n=1 Tax=Paenarthrobacter sp. NPDC058040 TaxID=3346309 RepID=UPI0036DF1382
MTAVVQSGNGKNTLQVNWSEPDINGDPIKNYYVTMNGGGAAAQTKTIPGNTRTTTFEATNSETGYTFTVQAENKAGKGGVSAASAPRRATGKLGTVGNVSATPANTGGAGGQVTINFAVLNKDQRNGSSANEVSYTYRASTGQSGPIQPGQTVGGFGNGQASSITVTAQSSVAPSSDASAAATATPYGAPGTPSASGQDGGVNTKSVTFSWSSPSPASNDVRATKISVDGGGWETVGASGSRTVNTAGWEETHSIRVQTFNSLGTGGSIASASAKSGKEGVWQGVLNTGVVQRSCTYTLGGMNYQPSPDFTCDGKGGNQPPWEYPGQNMIVKCYIVQKDVNNITFAWWRIEAGSARNAGRYIIAGHTTVGEPGSVGAPPC